MPQERMIIAIAAGDPAGIGPAISLKAARDTSVRAMCRPLLVCDAGILARHAKACGIGVELRAVRNARDADWSGDHINVLDCALPYAAGIAFSANSADAGRASIAFCRAAVKAAMA